MTDAELLDIERRIRLHEKSAPAMCGHERYVGAMHDLFALAPAVRAARAERDQAIKLLREYNTWAGTADLKVDERARLMHAVTEYLISVTK